MIVPLDLSRISVSGSQPTSTGTLSFAFYSSIPSFLATDEGKPLRTAIGNKDKKAIANFAKDSKLRDMFVTMVADRAAKMLEKARAKLSTSSATPLTATVTLEIPLDAEMSESKAAARLNNAMVASTMANKALKPIMQEVTPHLTENNISEMAGQVYDKLLAALIA